MTNISLFVLKEILFKIPISQLVDTFSLMSLINSHRIVILLFSGLNVSFTFIKVLFDHIIVFSRE